MKSNSAKNIVKKKALIILIIMGMMVITMGGCFHDGEISGSKQAVDDRKTIICSGFAEYDWVSNILGSNPGGFKLTLLNDSGLDMHSFQPSVADMVAVSKADLLIFTGGDSENWLKEAVLSSGKSPGCIYQMSETFTHTHELIGSYSLECESDHHDEKNIHHHEHKFDEHLWLSLKMAPVFINDIAQKIAALDTDNADTYLSNAASYIDSIKKLDRDFEEKLKLSKENRKNTLLFADRFPFKYLLEDYDIEHAAAFPGCSAETEASFHTIVSLTETMERLGLNSVIVLKKSKTDLAETIISGISCSEARILSLDSMQSVTSGDISSGQSYLSTMQNNLEVILSALEQK